MSTNPFSSLTKPPRPPFALCLTETTASVVQLARRGGAYTVPRAGQIELPRECLQPSFDEPNILNHDELSAVLGELVTSTGLNKQKQWSIALPEAATRSAILTMDVVPSSRAELDEMLQWKIERAFGASAAELRATHQQLSDDDKRRPRFLASAMRRATLAEYESVFAQLGWHAGLILPAHIGEAAWLMNGKQSSAFDSLLVNSHAQGFTGLIARAGAPLLVRSILCEPSDRVDEFYRLLLFYRDRLVATEESLDEPHSTNEVVDLVPLDRIERVFVTGAGLDETQVRDMMQETLNTSPRTLRAEDVQLALPSKDLSFNDIAAPAGLAAMHWK